MNPTGKWRHGFVGLVLPIGMLLSNAIGAPGADGDLMRCRQQLRQIGDAVAAYRQDHKGEFPPALGKLFGSYLTDSSVLQCPAARKVGDVGPSNPNLLELSGNDGQVVGYTWEMSWEDPMLWEGKIPFREFRKLQLQSPLGRHVPIVRCTHHPETGDNSVLNLTVDGRIYKSGEYWEANFVETLPGTRLTSELVHLAGIPMAQLVRPRPKIATDAMIDLRERYNARFEDPWVHSHRGEEWTSFLQVLRDGMLTSRGVLFEAAGIIQLNGKIVPDGHDGYTRLMYPTNAAPIEVNRRCQVLHVLGGVVFTSEPGSVVARLELLGEGAHSLAIWEWKYGIDVARVNYLQGEKPPAGDGVRIAWSGELKHGSGEGRQIRLFHLRFVNSGPDVLVSQIRFSSGNAPSAPFITAITVE